MPLWGLLYGKDGMEVFSAMKFKGWGKDKTSWVDLVRCDWAYAYSIDVWLLLHYYIYQSVLQISWGLLYGVTAWGHGEVQGM